VDLPLPVGPTTATISPGPTSNVTSWSTGGRSGYANVRLENRMAGASESRRGGAEAAGAGRASASTCCTRSIDASPRRTMDSVNPSATVGHARYAR
jgi:hypothetical protein